MPTLTDEEAKGRTSEIAVLDSPVSASRPITATSRVRDGAYVPEIDGLRAVAVGTVILYHLNPLLMPGGFVGVDVFFVISGYVVSASLGRDAGRSFFAMLQHFYARRIVRIVPALLACLLVTTAAAILFIPTSWLSNANQVTDLYAFFGASNFALLGADSYFSPRPEFNPFTQTWSLAVEEQFYLFFPAIFFVWSRFRDRRGITGFAANALLTGLAVLSFVFMWWISRFNRQAAFYLLPSRFWELAVGAILFQVQCSGTSHIASAIRKSFALSLGATLVLAAALFSNRRAFPFPWSAPAVIGACLIISAVSSEQPLRSPVTRLLRSPPMVFIGKISYPLYLWHWSVYTLFRWTVGLHGLTSMVMALGLSFLFAYLSYTLLECPIRFGRWVGAQRKSFIIAVGLTAIVLGWGTARLAFLGQHRLSLSVVMREAASWYPNRSAHQGDTEGCTVKWTSEPIDGANVKVSRRRCAEPMSPPRRLFVVGDSHAGAYSAMFSLLTGQHGIEVRVYLKPDCSFANLLSPSTPNCAAFIRATTMDIGQSAAVGDVVFLASLRMNRLGDQWGPFTAAEIAEMTLSARAVTGRRLAYDEAVDLIGNFSRQDLRVIIEAPKPVFRAPAFRCSDWFNAGNPACQGGVTIGREELLEYRKPVMDSLAALSSAYPNHLVVWDPFPVLCPQNPCRAVTEAGPLFFDGDHLSNVGNQLLYPDFLSVLGKVWAVE